MSGLGFIPFPFMSATPCKERVLLEYSSLLSGRLTTQCKLQHTTTALSDVSYANLRAEIPFKLYLLLFGPVVKDQNV